MIRPLRPSDIVAGLPIYDEDGGWLGISTGPPHNGVVTVCDESGPEPTLSEVEWRAARIGGRAPA